MNPTSIATHPLVLAESHPGHARMWFHEIAARAPVALAGLATTGREALRLCAELRPPLLVASAALADFDGISLLRRMREAAPGTGVLLVSATTNVRFLVNLMRHEPGGLWHEDDDPEELAEVAEAVLAGRRHFSTKPARERAYQKGASVSILRLTPPEHETLRLLAAGLTAKEVAEVTGVSVRTVEGHSAKLRNGPNGTWSIEEMVEKARGVGEIE